MAYDTIKASLANRTYEPPEGYFDKIDPNFIRSAESKILNFTTRFNQVGKSDTTFTMRFDIPKGNILDTNMHILLQKPEVIYLFNSGLTPTTIRETLHNVNPSDFTSEISIKKTITIGNDGLNVGK